MSAVGTEARLDLRRLLVPSSVAVVGATDRPGAYGNQALLNLESVGYTGEVWGVNPQRDEVLGYPCVPTVADLPVAVDSVVVAIPAAGVPEVIEQAGARGCGGAVVISAGFAEVAEGVQLSRELVAAAARHRLAVCGPNCNGIVSPHHRISLWGDALFPPEAGSVALISQSGNVAVNALATSRGLRFHTVVASGNQAVVSAAEYLEFLAREPQVGSIALYLEDDGGPRLCEALAACAEIGVPVVVLKVGESQTGARAAAAHSAALAGDQRVFRALVREAGAIWADDVHELLELAKTLAVPSRRAGSRGLAIMTCSGGDSAQGADECARLGIELPQLAPATDARLRELLPVAATVANPLDYTAILWGDRGALSELVRTLGDDPGIGQVLVFYDQPRGLSGAPEESWRATREAVIAGAALSPVPTMISSTLPELLDDEAAWEFTRAGVAAAAGLRTGLRCIAARWQSPGDPTRLLEIAATARAARNRAHDGDGGWLAEHEAKELLQEHGVAVPPGRVVDDENDAVRALGELGGHVALKLSGASIQHKSDIGAVAVGLTSEDEIRAAYRRLTELTHEHGGSVLAEAMAAPCVELIVAAQTDGIVPALVLGLGGVWTELVDDVAIVPLPASAPRIELALRELRGAALLFGGRGGESVDVGAAARLAQSLGEVLVQQSLALVECNPVLVGADGAIAVDASIRRAGADA